ncbi:MAG: hypothetical protein PHX04_00445 [Bacilli bacterium]|nr:hypothetical protein [Bacilli bacterium]
MKIDQKLLKTMGFALGCIIIFIIIIALISSCIRNKKYTYEELEAKLINLSKNYYDSNKESLPKDGENTSLKTEYFITNGNLKHLTLTTGETCFGEIIVSNSNGYYLYSPILTCGDIKTINLTDKLKEDVTTTGEGLYNYGSSYIYRGENINNYLLIGEGLYRIIKINHNDEIRIIENKRSESTSWDNRYNIDKNSNEGINDFISNNINSRIKSKLEESYDGDKFTDEEKAYFVKQDLCIGKRSIKDNVDDGSIECSATIENQMFGLITVNEYLQASLDANCLNITSPSCTNYNYLAKLESSTWTLTADKDTSYKAYRLDYSISLTNTSNSSGVAIVAHLNKNTLYQSGTGTLNDPYIIK